MSCIYEFGKDDYTIANVMFEAKDLFPTPEKTRVMRTCVGVEDFWAHM